MTGLEIALGVLTGAECSHLFYGRLPSRMTTRKFADDKDKAENLKAIYESIGIGFLLALVVAYAMKSYLVFGIAIFMIIALAVLYLNDLMGWW